jgi:hypothetical protein
VSGRRPCITGPVIVFSPSDFDGVGFLIDLLHRVIERCATKHKPSDEQQWLDVVCPFVPKLVVCANNLVTVFFGIERLVKVIEIVDEVPIGDDLADERAGTSTTWNGKELRRAGGTSQASKARGRPHGRQEPKFGVDGLLVAHNAERTD